MTNPSRASLAVSLLTVLTLCGCAGAQNIHSVKADDYTKTPQRVLIALPMQPYLSDPFKTTLATALAKCGTTVQFTPNYTPLDAKAGHFDAVMRSNSLGQETTTVTHIASGAQSSYVDMVRYEFALIDTETQKNVWKEQIDFTKGNGRAQSEASSQEVWAKALFDSMVKNKLVGSCDSDRAVPVASPLAYASALPFKPAAPATPGKPAALSFKVGGTSYTTADAALDALRTQADSNVAQITQTAPHMYEPLLIVVPTSEEIERSSIKIPGLPNEADFKKYMIGAREIPYDTYAKAFRKNALFREITSVRSDQVKPGDFLGNRYKLWFALPEGKGMGSWVLASAKGGEQRFQITDNNEKNQISGMLINIKSALEKLPQ